MHLSTKNTSMEAVVQKNRGTSLACTRTGLFRHEIISNPQHSHINDKYGTSHPKQTASSAGRPLGRQPRDKASAICRLMARVSFGFAFFHGALETRSYDLWFQASPVCRCRCPGTRTHSPQQHPDS